MIVVANNWTEQFHNKVKGSNHYDRIVWPITITIKKNLYNLKHA